MLKSMAALLLLVASVSADQCDMAGTWSAQDGAANGRLLPAIDLSTGGFNLTMDIRHGPQTVQGRVFSNNTVAVGFNPPIITYGQFTPNCSVIVWNNSKYGDNWCRSWSKGCKSLAPPYGQGFSFSETYGSNMVLQQGPAQAAVYGILVGGNTVKVKVEGEGKSYILDAKINATHDPHGPDNATLPQGKKHPVKGGGLPPGEFIGPFTTWKALLPPTPAGGNYTITAMCTDCTQDPMWTTINITNVTFGDVWHCSGQSNMWLPLINSFSRNDTLDGILHKNKYHNIRIMDGNSGNGVNNPWRTALQAALSGNPTNPDLFQFGAACWYFAQQLTEKWMSEGKDPIPIGLADTAIGGQRIEEYMDNSTINICTDRAGENVPVWNGELFGKMIMPFTDMTVKGWLWYQGENNMGATKGNSIANVGYGCEMRELVRGWRRIWSTTPNTTDPLAPFGVVTLASSGSEGGPHMGAMRWSQTANYGVLPNPVMPNTFLAQAYDLDDPWGPALGPCFAEWQCCSYKHVVQNMTVCNNYTHNNPGICKLACEAADGTPVAMGGIHPRDKKPVGDRLARAAYNTVYGGTEPFTGPTISGCQVSDGKLVVNFNQTLLRGDTVIIQQYNQSLNLSYFEVQTNVSNFCVEPLRVNASDSKSPMYCPTWAGGNGKPTGADYDSGWQRLNITSSGSDAIAADLSPLNGVAPTALRYAWGITPCCDTGDPNLYVTHPCGPANCPIMGKSGLPANPFLAKIVDGKCECVKPQVCDG